MNIDVLLKEIDKMKGQTEWTDSVKNNFPSAVQASSVQGSIQTPENNVAMDNQTPLAQPKVIRLHPEMEVCDSGTLSLNDAHIAGEKPLSTDPKWLEDLINSADILSRKAKALRLPPLLLTEAYEPSLSENLKTEIKATFLTWVEQAEYTEILEFIKEIAEDKNQAKQYAVS